jgi:uncharacterized membrane protein
VREWTNWNHVRTIAALAAAALMIAGLDQPAFIAWSTGQW